MTAALCTIAIVLPAALACEAYTRPMPRCEAGCGSDSCVLGYCSPQCGQGACNAARFDGAGGFECVQREDGSVCARACSRAAPCPSGMHCAGVGYCAADAGDTD
mgnify:CR=1 FL=1